MYCIANEDRRGIEEANRLFVYYICPKCCIEVNGYRFVGLSRIQYLSTVDGPIESQSTSSLNSMAIFIELI